MMKKNLLCCGIISSLLYLVATIIGAEIWSDYSSTSQTVSELIAIQAPSAPFVVPCFIIYSILVIAFGIGIWLYSKKSKLLRASALLIILKEIIGLSIVLFFKIHLRGIQQTTSDEMHLYLTGIGVLGCMFPAICLAASALKHWFRIFSLIIAMLFLIFGYLTGLDAQNMNANIPTPWMGIYERINIFAYFLWMGVFTIVLLFSQKHQRRA
jgi:hypothetical protein